MTNRYDEVIERLRLMLEGEEDAIAIMATVACELHVTSSPQLDGVYRVTAPEQLTVGLIRAVTAACISFARRVRRCNARRPPNWCRRRAIRGISPAPPRRAPSWCFRSANPAR